MTKATHTPGPWAIRREIKNDVVGPDGKLLATAYIRVTADGYSDKTTIPTAEANARLMAAAPKMLAALEVSLDMLNQLLSAAEQGIVPDISIGFFKNRTQIIEPAIAMAKGGAA